MKEHLRHYFPERFENSPTSKLAAKAEDLLFGYNIIRRKLKCELKVIDIFKRSNELKLLAGAIKKYGCDFNLSRHVSCELCTNCSGGFDPDTKQIIICANNHLNDHKIMATMMHEMIHLFDYCRVKFDFDNLEHIACSEIRAANLSYCSVTDRLSFGGPNWFNFKKSHMYCVKDVAFRSVKAYSPETEDSKIWDIIDKVFPGCYNDLEPFGRRPTNANQDIRHSYRERYYYGYF